MNGAPIRPIAFMVMPFRKRPVPNAPGKAPKEIDFDALWDRAFRPALEQLGYLAVRADTEAGTVIIKDMLKRDSSTLPQVPSSGSYISSNFAAEIQYRSVPSRSLATR